MLLGAGKDLKIVRLAGGVAAGTDGSRQNLTAIDRAGYAGVAIVALIGTVTSTGVFTLRAKNYDDSGTPGSGTINDVGSAVGVTSDKLVIMDIIEPTKRYVRADYQRTVANVVIHAIFAILYNGDVKPVALDAGDVLTELLGPTPSAT
jgi:hypothetical protein